MSMEAAHSPPLKAQPITIRHTGRSGHSSKSKAPQILAQSCPNPFRPPPPKAPLRKPRVPTLEPPPMLLPPSPPVFTPMQQQQAMKEAEEQKKQLQQQQQQQQQQQSGSKPIARSLVCNPSILATSCPPMSFLHEYGPSRFARQQAAEHRAALTAAGLDQPQDDASEQSEVSQPLDDDRSPVHSTRDLKSSGARDRDGSTDGIGGGGGLGGLGGGGGGGSNTGSLGLGPGPSRGRLDSKRGSLSSHRGSLGSLDEAGAEFGKSPTIFSLLKTDAFSGPSSRHGSFSRPQQSTSATAASQQQSTTTSQSSSQSAGSGGSSGSSKKKKKKKNKGASHNNSSGSGSGTDRKQRVAAPAGSGDGGEDGEELQFSISLEAADDSLLAEDGGSNELENQFSLY